MSEANKALIPRHHEALWNAWNLGAIDELIAEDVAFRGSLGVTAQGQDGFRDYVALVRRAFPDFHNRVEQLMAEGWVLGDTLGLLRQLGAIPPPGTSPTRSGRTREGIARGEG